MKKFLKSTDNTRKPRLIRAIAIDTETDPDTGKFILASVFGEIVDGRDWSLRTIDKTFYSSDELKDFIISLEKRNIRGTGKKRLMFALVFHNAPFDLYYIEDIIDWSTAIYSGNNLITVYTKNGTPVYDTFNFVRSSLEAAIAAFSIEERFGVRKLDFSDLEARCKNDARATYYIFRTLQEFFNDEFGTGIGFTLPGTAFKIYKKCFHTGVWIRDNDAVDVFERSAYYGGRCEVYVRGEVEVDSYDVNSMYPAMMLKPLPNPGYAYWEYVDGKDPEELIRKRLASGKMFIVEAEVTVPDQRIPPLPFRYSVKGTGITKLVFPVGTFKGVWCSPEIEAALRYGTKINRIYRMLSYSKSDTYLAGYSAEIYRKRLEAKANNQPVHTYMYKLLLNSLYGKFAEKRKGINYVPLDDWKGDLEGETIIRSNNRDYVVVRKEAEESMHTFCCISAFITSYARAYLFTSMKQNEADVVYCDTDSIKVKAGAVPGFTVSETELGAFKYEGRSVSVFFKPKLYSGKMKGVPKKHTVMEKTETEIVVRYTTVTKRKEAIRRGISQNLFLDVLKKIKLQDDKRVWKGQFSDPISIISDP